MKIDTRVAILSLIFTIIGVAVGIRQCQIAESTTNTAPNTLANTPTIPDNKPREVVSIPKYQPKTDNNPSDSPKRPISKTPFSKSKPIVEETSPTPANSEPLKSIKDEKSSEDFNAHDCYRIQGNSDGGGAIQLFGHPTKGIQPLPKRLEPGTRVIILAKTDNKEMIKIKAANGVSGWVPVERVLPCQ